MKTLRFVKNLLREARELVLTSIVAAAIVGIFWCLGWVAHSLGMPAPTGSAVKDMPNFGCGLVIILILAFTALAITGIVGAWKWLRDQWRSA